MRSQLLLISLSILVSSIYCEDELPLATPCVAEACQLPDCRCASTNIPGGLQARDTPQFVLVTFDDGVNVLNIETYRNVLYNRRNKNGCPIKATYFINHEYTDYRYVNELYNEGFEIALHSVTHSTPQNYWADADYETILREFGDQRFQMAHFANIPYEDINGIRVPFLQMNGNNTFRMLKETGMVYDLTWPTYTYIDPGLWPYTTDYATIQDCSAPPCPTASIPGVWVFPIINWKDSAGFTCAMVDACTNVPSLTDADAWLALFLENFERHYLGNRAPFGYYAHEWHMGTYPAVREAFMRFLDIITNIEDVFLVSPMDVISWVKSPQTIPEYNAQVTSTCNIPREPRACSATTCGPLYSDHNEYSGYYMTQCTTCPPRYPWLGNPFGL